MPSVPGNPRSTRSTTAGQGIRLNVVAVVLLIAGVAAGGLLAAAQEQPLWMFAGAAVGIICALSPRVANQWERAIVLRLGRYVGTRGPGLLGDSLFSSS